MPLRSFVVSLLALAAIGSVAAQGRLMLEPTDGIVGSEVVATMTDLTPGTEVDVVWVSAAADWSVADGRFYGVTAEETRTVVASATVAADGTATAGFRVPEDFGYVHNVFVEAGDEAVARGGFIVVPHLTIEPTSGPVGTPITVTMTGIGYRFWEIAWHLLYDGAHAGMLTAITTQGTAVATIPATGAPGLHTLQLLSGTHPVPYLNQQQSPNYKPAIPTVVSALFEVTDGPAVMPPPPEAQTLARDGATAPTGEGPRLWADHASGPVGSPIALQGAGFAPDTLVRLALESVRGNRISGGGWEVVETDLAEVRTDAAGAFALTLPTPDDLGGAHPIHARAADGAEASFAYTITPSVRLASPAVVEPGGDVTVVLKGVGWTETANIYTVLLNNGYLGYGCGFNSQGDVTIHLKAPGQEGVHFLSFYPAIYQGEVTGPGAPPTPDANATYLQVPMLHAEDHPGERLPAMHLAFEVRAP
jgi:hypothetical protein